MFKIEVFIKEPCSSNDVFPSFIFRDKNYDPVMFRGALQERDGLTFV